MRRWLIPGDVRDANDVQRAVQAALDRWGKLDILVANAGFGYRLSVVEGDPQRWKDMIDTNVYGLLLTLEVWCTASPGAGRGSRHRDVFGGWTCADARRRRLLRH